MSDPAALTPLDLLILTRLLPAGEKGETAARIQKDLEPLLRHRWAGSVLTSQIERTLVRLASLGLVERTERGGVVCPFAAVHIDMEIRAVA